jgi:hypothetical protein
MREINIPIVVGITTWRDEKHIKASVKSVIDFADFIVIAYGKVKNEEPDRTLKILRHLQIDYQDLITLLLPAEWSNEVEQLNATWFEFMGYYFRLRGNEVLSKHAKKELEKLIYKSIETGLPITAKTTKSDIYEFRGSQIDPAKYFISPTQVFDVYDSNHQESLQMECKIIHQ